MTDPGGNTEAAPSVEDQGPIRQVAVEDTEQDQFIEFSRRPKVADDRLDQHKARWSIEIWAEKVKSKGKPRAVARAEFRDNYEDHVAHLLSERGVDHIFRKVYDEEDHDTRVEDAVENILVREEARERVDILKRGRPDGIQVVTSGEVLMMDDPLWLVDGMLPEQGTFQLYGDSNTGKSFVVLDLLLAIATGEKWLGYFPVNKTGPVVYVAAEGGFDLKDRVSGWGIAHGDFEPLNFQAVIEQGLDLRLQHDVDQLMDVLRPMEPVAIVFDTWALHMPGGDENSAKDAGQVIAVLKRMSAELHALIGTVHHTGKDASNGARGSSAMRAAWDIEFLMTGTQLIHTKARASAKHEPIGIVMASVPVHLSDERTTLIPRRVSALAAAAEGELSVERQVLDAVRAMPGRRRTPIREAMKSSGVKIHNNTFKIQMDGLIAAGRIEERDGGLWVADEDK